MAGKRRVFALAAALSCVVLARAATAAPTANARDRARAKLAEGAKLLEAQRFGDALARFEEAYALVPSPKIFYNLGRAHVGLGREPEAFEAFERFVDEAKDAGAQHLAHARSEVARLGARIARVELACDVEGAEVNLDGRKIGTTPLRRPIVVPPGTHQIAVSSSPHGMRTRAFNAAAGETVRLPIELRSPEVAMRPPPPEASPSREDSPVSSAPRTRDEPDTPPVGIAWTRTARWVALGVAVAALSAGLYFNTTANDKSDSYAYCIDPNRGARDAVKCKPYRDQRDSAMRLAIGSYIAAGLVGASAVTLFVVAPPAEPARAGAPGFGLAFAARF